MNLYSVFLFAVHTAATSRKVGATPPPIVKQCFPSRPVYTKTGGSGGQWRNLLPAVFATWSSHELSRSLQGGDVYEFGVFREVHSNDGKDASFRQFNYLGLR